MRNILYLMVCVFLAACGRVWSKPAQILHASLNGVSCVIELDLGANETVRVYSTQRKEIWRGISKSLKPWKIIVGDVDGDGRTDLGVGVYKTTRFHPVMAKRPFVYTWNGKAFVPKWLGSRLTRPFTDFTFAAFKSGPKLVSIEEIKGGGNELAVYKWDGFGFTRVWTGCRAKKLSGLAVSGEVVRVWSYGSHKTYRTYAWDGKALKEAKS